ncbi:hypothetical protein [Streptomyces sp. NPDC042319]|uniref:hypothetical protein n=1 Tax=Streptomyces sp. NPDC042319 TaxID=3154332 RepID=UPI0033E2191B
MGILPRFDGAKPKKGNPKRAGAGKPQVPIGVVVEQAVKKLPLPSPVIRTSPDEDFVQVVHVPTWMWVQHRAWDPVSASAAVDGLKVTATALPRKAVWTMGEGGKVVCKGPGTPYSDKYAPTASSPDCGYTYRRSSHSRAGRSYTVKVTVTWDVQWHGGGQAGQVPGMAMAAERQLVVDEVQAVVVR